MANTYPETNTRISNLVSSEVPFFVRNDHQNFVRFLEAYYEYLEQSDANSANVVARTTDYGKTSNTLGYYNVITRIKNMNAAFDIDRTSADFAEKLNEQFMALIPKDVQVDKAMLLKNIKDFYRAKGTEKSVTFLLNILFGGGKDVSFYYPKTDVLRASDGKWFIEKSIKITDVKINGVANTSDLALLNFANTIVTGNSSRANAIVEKVESYFEGGVPVKELKISSQKGNFDNGETIFSLFTEGGITKSITANVFGGIISSATITVGGNGYTVGTQVPIISNTGSNGIVTISSVTSGNVLAIGVLAGGAGFQANDSVIFSGGGGAGATGNVLTVLTDNSIHPNSYNIVYTLISGVANVTLNTANYAANSIEFQINSNANTTLTNALSTFVYGNTGPIVLASLINAGDGYSSLPTLDVVANTRVKALGILGRLEVVSGGSNYANGEIITIENVAGGYGTGALANVKSVNATGAIVSVQFIQMPGHIIGGTGYSQTALPRANIQTTSGVNGNVMVRSVLGDGENLSATTSSIGRILGLRVDAGGTGYDANTTLSFVGIGGDNTAQATVTTVQGVYTYPGRYLNDDGHLSSYNFLQDRDYYQNFSYVVRLNESLNAYRKALLDLTHPTGMKLFGEYMLVDEGPLLNVKAYRAEDKATVFSKSTYVSTGNLIVINTTTATGLEANDEVYLEFVSGDTINISNGLFVVTGNANTTSFNVTHSNSSTTSGDVYVGVV